MVGRVTIERAKSVGGSRAGAAGGNDGADDAALAATEGEAGAASFFVKYDE